MARARSTNERVSSSLVYEKHSQGELDVRNALGSMEIQRLKSGLYLSKRRNLAIGPDTILVFSGPEFCAEFTTQSPTYEARFITCDCGELSHF